MHLAPPKAVALLAALAATGCFSTIDGPQDEADDGADDGAGAPPETGTEGPDATDGTDGTDPDGLEGGAGGGGGDGTDGGSDTPPPVVMESGTYRITRVTIQDDPCGWDAYIAGGIGPFLPDWFDLDGDLNRFDIAGQRFNSPYAVGGGPDPVTCVVDGDAFTCETQVVAPSKNLLGSYGWTYIIDFAGVVVSEQALEGTAVVDFDVDLSFAPYLGLPEGWDPTGCTQVLDLRIERGAVDDH